MIEDIKLHRYCCRYATSVTESTRSNYYRFPGNIVLRISDHYAQNSSGIFTIIVTDLPEQYIVTSKVTEKIKLYTYKQVKSFIKSLSQVAEFLPWNNLIGSGKPVSNIGALDTFWMSKAQLDQIRSWYMQKFHEELKLF